MLLTWQTPPASEVLSMASCFPAGRVLRDVDPLPEDGGTGVQLQVPVRSPPVAVEQLHHGVVQFGLMRTKVDPS